MYDVRWYLFASVDVGDDDGGDGDDGRGDDGSNKIRYLLVQHRIVPSSVRGLH